MAGRPARRRAKDVPWRDACTASPPGGQLAGAVSGNTTVHILAPGHPLTLRRRQPPATRGQVSRTAIPWLAAASPDLQEEVGMRRHMSVTRLDRPWHRPGASRYALRRLPGLLRPPVGVYEPGAGSLSCCAIFR